MATEKEVQDFLHALEEGAWAPWVRWAVALAAVATLVVVMMTRFIGLSAPEGMEQAAIAREIARGDGFSTKTIRPMALWQLKQYPAGNIPDTFHAPLNPWLNSLFLRLRSKDWKITPATNVYAPDKVIAEVAIGLFLLSAGINYLTARRLFDARLAAIGLGLILLCDSFWQYAFSGLPQMLMLFLFSAAVHALTREGILWTAAAGVFFGLLALAHGLTIWIFAGALVYACFAFGVRRALPMLGLFVLLYAPWLVRDHRVCGDAFGLGIYACLDGVVHSGSAWMRSPTPLFDAVGPGAFLYKFRTQAASQFDGMYGLLGGSLAAPLFFPALLHPFKRASLASLRWGLLLMGLGAFLGMCFFGLGDAESPDPNSPNNLYILFTPMMICYGLAFLLALWNRLENGFLLVRIGLLSLLYAVSAIPLLNGLLKSQGRFHWPPYVPPVIALINGWTNEKEIVCSDMPWAVAWYADRKCLWLPSTMKQFLQISDYAELGSPLVGLFLTPVTGNGRLQGDILSGEYADWARIILGAPPPARFPLQYPQVFFVRNQCIYLSDWPRWKSAR